MSKVLVLYYSTYGHIETMAEAVAEGARQAGADVDVKRVPETVPEDVANAGHFKLDQKAPIAAPADLANYDAVIVGTPTRFGRMASQMAAFWDQTGGLWAKGALVGKVGAAFVSTATQHGGQETTLFSVIANLLHHGMVVVGLNYGFADQMRLDEVTGGAPYGATTIAGGDGSRAVSDNEKAGARYLGKTVAETAAKLIGGAHAVSSVNIGWLLLVVAGLLDVAWAYAMKLSDGLTQPGWTLLAILVLGVIVVVMGRAVLVIPVGTAYAVFTGVGAIGTVVLGIVMFGESTAFARLACIGLIVAGAVGLKLFPN